MSSRAHMARPDSGRVIAGVCAGLGDRADIDPGVFRLLFILLAFAGGAGIFLYALLWLLMPPAGERSRRLGRIARGNLERLPAELARARDRALGLWSQRGRDARIAAVALLGGGACLLLWSFGAFEWLTATRLLAIIAIIAGAAVFWSVGQR